VLLNQSHVQAIASMIGMTEATVSRVLGASVARTLIEGMTTREKTADTAFGRCKLTTLTYVPEEPVTLTITCTPELSQLLQSGKIDFSMLCRLATST